MIPLRDENPTHSTPIFVIVLIVLNILAFLYEVSLGSSAEAFIYQFGILPWEVAHGENLKHSMFVPPVLTLITSMFLHGGIGHIIGNMWFLWLFGDNIEDTIGHFRFLTFYFVCGIAAGAVHIALDPNSTIPTIGASGAISGVLGGYIVLFPKIRIRTLITLGFFFDVIRVPAIFFLGLWFLTQAMGWLGPQTGVAFAAHIGGFVAGVLYTLLLTKPSRDSLARRYETRRLPRW